MQRSTQAPAPPPAQPAPNAPSGPVTAAAPCCPDTAFFERSKAGRTSYWAYDDTTTAPANPGADEYWIKSPGNVTIDTSAEPRDASRWVSVGVGRDTRVTIEFGGTFTVTCLANCKYEVDPQGIADVSPPLPTGSGMAFKIKGKAPGEANLKVICDGKLRGYFRIWCKAPVSIDVDVASLVTPHSAAAGYVVADLEAYMNEVYRQVLITVNLNDAGAIPITPTATTYMNGAGAADIAHMLEMDTLAQAASKKLTSNYRLYYYVNTAGHSGGLGIVPGGLGAPGPGYAFFDHHVQGSYNTMAHEFGHLLNLSHPAHDSDQDEYPTWQLGNMHATRFNVLNDDPDNLMGYNGSLAHRAANRIPMRYLQWKKCKRS